MREAFGQPYRVAAIAIAVFLFGAICYRAATQSVVHDEAFAWQTLLRGPNPGVFRDFRVNNHFLQTVLSWLSVSVFGPSALALRLPSLLAGGWFLYTAVRLAFLLCGSGPAAPLLVWLLGGNPLVLDFFVAARGYGLALALLFWALYRVAEFVSNPVKTNRWSEWRPFEAGVSVGLSAAANLAFLIPGAVLAAACAFVLRASEPVVQMAAPKKKRPGRAARSSSPWAAPARLAGGVALAGVMFLITAPIETAKREDFYAGSSSLLESARSVASSSFAHNEGTGGLLRPLGEVPAIALGSVLAVLTAAAWAASFKRTRGLSGTVQWIAATAVLGSWLVWVAGHYATAMLYPQDRSGLFFIPLALLAAVPLASSERLPAFARPVALVSLVVIAVSFAIQWNVSSFVVWRYDADTPRLLDRLRSEVRPNTPPLRLGASWQLAPSLTYYRETGNLGWLAPIELGGADADFDFYALIPADQPLISRRGLRLVLKGAASGTVLAARPAR